MCVEGYGWSGWVCVLRRGYGDVWSGSGVSSGSGLSSAVVLGLVWRLVHVGTLSAPEVEAAERYVGRGDGRRRRGAAEPLALPHLPRVPAGAHPPLPGPAGRPLPAHHHHPGRP